MVERELPKLLMRVRFPLPAPYKKPLFNRGVFYMEKFEECNETK